MGQHESAALGVRWTIAKYDGDVTEAVGPVRGRLETWGRRMRVAHPWLARRLEMPAHKRKEAWFRAHEAEIVEGDGNLLMYGGASCFFQTLIGNGTGTSGQTLTYFNNGNAYLGVGDSSSAVAATQTDLQAATNKTRVAMDATYPQHSDGTTSGAASIVYRSSFTAANYQWNELALFNGSSGGRMLARKLFSSPQTKASGTWVLTYTASLA